ncbi:MAG: hypothetical protein QXH08_00835 [Candidatus Hadarchaeales archaeon]
MFVPPSEPKELLQLPEFHFGVATIIVIAVGASATISGSAFGISNITMGLIMALSTLGSIGYVGHRIVREFFPPIPIFTAFGILLLVAGIQSLLTWPWHMWTSWATMISGATSLYGVYRKSRSRIL